MLDSFLIILSTLSTENLQLPYAAWKNLITQEVARNVRPEEKSNEKLHKHNVQT